MTQREAGDDGRTIEPCKHMENWVNGLADGSLTGIRRGYMRLHVSGCGKCRTALNLLIRLRVRLHDLQAAPDQVSPLDPVRREALDAALSQVESNVP